MVCAYCSIRLDCTMASTACAPEPLKRLLGIQTSNLQCEVCTIAKHTQKFEKMKQTRATQPYELIHSDLCGPLKASVGGASYYIVYIDDFSRYTEVHFLVTKGAAEITSKFKTFKAAVENKGYIIRRFRCDNGTEDFRCGSGPKPYE
jgi:hypothetical protein